MRTPHREYPEYYTSADNLQFVTAAVLGESWRLMRLTLGILDEDRVFLNLSPKEEPMSNGSNYSGPQFVGRPLQFARHCRTCPYAALEPPRRRPASCGVWSVNCGE